MKKSKNKKVYCRECKWWEGEKMDWCFYPTKERCALAEEHLGKRGGKLCKFITNCKKFNKTNSCPHFSPRWYIKLFNLFSTKS